MLHSSIEVKDSSIQGIGLFALELIPAHSVLWKLDPCDAPTKLEEVTAGSGLYICIKKHAGQTCTTV